MPPFGPEGVSPFVEAAQAVLAPLAVGAAAASVVWSLQDRLVAVGADLRERAVRLRRGGDGESDPRLAGEREQVRLLLRRARVLQAAVFGFYAALLLQVLAASAVGLALAGFAFVTPAGILATFFPGVAVLLAASGLALADTVLSFRAARLEYGRGDSKDGGAAG